MLATGSEKLERMRDGRVVYIGAERVDDVTSHPAFRNGARTIATLYDLKADPAKRDLFTFDDNGECIGLQWLRCRSREDLARRMRAMKAIADATYGLIGRSPDHVAGLITGLAMRPELLNGLRPGFGDNLMRFYERARKDDLYLSFAVTPPSGIRDREIYTGVVRDDPTLQVVSEDGSGVVVSGMKMLATGAIFGDEVYIGNLTAIDDKRQSESITAAIPNNAPGVSFWAREPYERHARQEADYPLSYRFDENDAVLVCDRVKIPWERVFLHNNGGLVAPHLYRDAGQRLSEPAVQHPLLGQDGTDRRAGEPDVPGQRRCRQGAGGARDSWAASPRSKPLSAAWSTAADRALAKTGRRVSRRRTGAWSTPRSIGARSTTPKSSTLCAPWRAPRRCKCRPASISSPIRNSRIVSSAGGVRQAWKPARATSSTSWSGT